MPRAREPIALIEAKGKSHKTKAEIACRRAEEVHIISTEVTPPPTLLKEQKAAFERYAALLDEVGVWSAADADVLAQYCAMMDEYWSWQKRVRSYDKSDPYGARAKVAHARRDKAMEACLKLGAKLGLNPVDRCKLRVPQPPDAPTNKFDKFT